MASTATNHINEDKKTLSLKEWVGFFAMVFGMFMAILDIQIVASSLSEIQAGLSATRSEISWVQTSYIIAEVIVIPLTGFLSRAFSTKIVFCFSCLGFTIMSILCACAWDLNSIIIFRGLQGLLGGAMIPTVFATIFLLFPKEKRNVVTIFVGLVVTTAPIFGPILGGYITQAFSWEWMFLINVPFGIMVSVLIWNYLDIDQGDLNLLKNFDWIGMISMAIFLASVEYFLEEGTSEDWFESSKIRFCFFVILVSSVCFFYRTLTCKEPVVDLTSFKDKNFSLACLLCFILGIGLFGSSFLLPSFLSSIRRLNSLQIGKIMSVTGMFQMCSAPIVGLILKKNTDPRIMVTFGFLTFSLGIFLNSKLTADSDFTDFFLPQAIIGFSLMFCFIPINTLALGTLSKEKIKNASGIYNLMRNLGGALGLAIINSLLNRQSAIHYGNLADNINNARLAGIAKMGGAFYHNLSQFKPYSEKIILRMTYYLTKKQALVMSFNDCYFVISIFLFVVAFASIFMKNVKEEH